jgi:hypothetical protein
MAVPVTALMGPVDVAERHALPFPLADHSSPASLQTGRRVSRRLRGARPWVADPPYWRPGFCQPFQ